jgi:NADH-quinone oxidoreductase subunit F
MTTATPTDVKSLREAGLRSLYPPKAKVSVGMATCGAASGAGKVYEAILAEREKQGLDLLVTKTGCLGYCQKEPLISVMKPGWPKIVFGDLTPETAREVLAALGKGEILRDYALCRVTAEKNLIENTSRRYPDNWIPAGLDAVPEYGEIPFFGRQEKRVLRNCGLIDPERIEEYIACGGYVALQRVLTQLTPEVVIEEVAAAGLRGRGGAGFPTGTKWRYCRETKGEPKYVICNADEGDPGAYMDRSILEADPHSVIEGMIIGAYAIGASHGVIFVRAEYPLAVQRIQIALRQAGDLGLLGNDILGSGFNFSIGIDCGSGAFVSGEETSLIAAIESLSGEPRPRPPFPVQSGLWGKPTNINNVKTWANVPLILSRGAEWFSQLGTEGSKGTMVFSLVGKVRNSGLVEVPMGNTLRSLVFDIGGGIPDGGRFKAVQTGGPSGGCIPAALSDLPVDYEELAKAGSIMGSGGLVVMDEDTCMVDVAKYFLAFTIDESCGKCVPCREGVRRMHEVINDITEGRGQDGDIELLEELGTTIIDTSLCGLGGTAPNPVLTTIRYFSDEYDAHIRRKRCPAAVCREIISSPCQHTCPLGADVPGYVGLIARGDFVGAARLIRLTNPLPNVCARACFFPCERKCNLGGTEEAIAIRCLKRVAMDSEFDEKQLPSVTPTQIVFEKVAVIGSGPAGLAAAQLLRNKGYAVTIFEALPVLGGMLSSAIPEFRLPTEVLRRDLDHILASGVEAKTRVRLGEDITVDDLRSQGYQAILLATGCHKSIKLNLPGEESEGVLGGLEFLKAVKLGEPISVGKRVGVIGGGNTAIDAARVAGRVGGREVIIFYRRDRAEMPAAAEIEGARKEGIEFRFLAAPKRIIATDGKLEAVEFIQMQLGEFDQSGRRRPVPIDGSEVAIELDTLIAAIGETVDRSIFGQALEITEWGTVAVDEENYASKTPGVFAAGDVVSGPATIVEGIAAGKEAAETIHRALRGRPLEKRYKITRPSEFIPPVKHSKDEQEEMAMTTRQVPAVLRPEERFGGFEEIERCLDGASAMKEARRCLRCDLQVATKEDTGDQP